MKPWAPLASPGASVEPLEPGGWRLAIPAGQAGAFRVAQVDDYYTLVRRRFRWSPPCRLVLSARASARDLPGTWGFGWWNDPFSLNLGLGGAARRVPALPNAAWFFHASPPNFLSFSDRLPAQGFLAAVFRAPRLPLPVMALGMPFLPLLAVPPAARLLRRLAHRLIGEDAAALDLDETQWHEYAVEWQPQGVVWRVDGREAFRTAVSPRPPLGVVIWVDNQYAAFPPGGRLKLGLLPSPQPAWLEVCDVRVEPGGET